MRTALDRAGYSRTSVGGQRDAGDSVFMAVLVEELPRRWSFSLHRLIKGGEYSVSFTLPENEALPEELQQYEERLQRALEVLGG